MSNKPEGDLQLAFDTAADALTDQELYDLVRGARFISENLGSDRFLVDEQVPGYNSALEKLTSLTGKILNQPRNQ